MNFDIYEDSADAVRKRTWKYLNRILPHGGMFPMQPVEREREAAGTNATVLRAVHDGDTIGAVYIGPSWEEATDAKSNGADAMAKRILRSVRSLHGIGVDPDHRSQGIGSALLKAVEARVASEPDTWLIIGVAHGAPELEGFYERHGYVLGEPSRSMILRVGSDVIVLPQSDPEPRWFYKQLTRDEAAGKPPVRAFHPTDRQLAMMRAGADQIAGERPRTGKLGV
ncbi:acetyltransferase (GNAT) family protein [Curtobacterium sp. AG1037]|uniref:GNAT family N-acetyltransferase n=1 Tax=Curtobacterium sp. AG1037 TaxID=2183990 RepID=UPI000E2BCCED|nr:GNAT family N-acetyltransferase [Curtobacterium sp. AG1037]RDH95079.1 acetyltransferase (GNAT) family protein [Curtobacterium sp. AG1037]